MPEAKEKPMTRKELMEKLKALGPMDKAKRNNVVCSLIGHSRIQETCWGYFHCARCGAQLGDQLGSVYDATEVVIVDHNCAKCRKNYKKLTWRDKLYVKNPFPKKKKKRRKNAKAKKS